MKEDSQTVVASNYIKQANWLTNSIFINMREVQKDALYFIMQNIDYHSENPSSKITIDFQKFLEYKGTIKNNFYSFDETLNILSELIETKGSFRNQITGDYVIFNLIDSVLANPKNPNQLDINLAKFGQIFLYEKDFNSYIMNSKALLPNNSKGGGFTQIEKNVISLNSYPQKKLFELLSRFKTKGFFTTSVVDLKMILGFISFVNKTNANVSDEEKQLQLIFSKNDESNYERIEKLTAFNDFKKKFIDIAVLAINNNPKLDITNLKYTTRRTGRKITHITFTFKKVLNNQNIDNDEKTCFNHFINFGLNEKQILFVMNRIGYENMYNRFNEYIERKKDNTFGVQYYSKADGKLIKNLSGFLYEKVFEELKN